MIIITARRKGKSLPETGYENRYAIIFRAITEGEPVFNSMDYVTRSEKFAKEHADHNAGMGEDSSVIRAMVKAEDVYEAYNPGEYFYDGPPVSGKVVYSVEGEEW
jgi:hypothetical protein